MHALIENGAVAQYPYGIGDLKRAYPDTSFPASMDDAALLEYGVHRVFFSTPPVLTPAQALEEDPPVFDAEAQRWAQVWRVRDKTEGELQADAAALQRSIVDATQARLDAFARTRNYDGILSACTYASSTVPKFQAEGQYCVEARDATWAKLYEMLAEVQAGTRPVPTGFADVESELPLLEWPA